MAISESAKIFIVEDDPIIAHLLSIRLNKLGYQVSGSANSSSSALEAIMRNPPDLIMMDISLGDGIDGIKLTRIIHERADIPIVFVTGNSDNETLKRVMETGPKGYIVKPFSDTDLRISLGLALCRWSYEPSKDKSDRSSSVLDAS